MPEYVTAKEAAELFRYSRTSSFLRAFRARGFSVWRTSRIGGRCLVKCDDLETFLSHNLAQVSTTDTVSRGT